MCNCTNYDTIPGILISGGVDTESSVEVLNPTTGKTCSLPSLPDQRGGHTSTGLTLCGGRDTRTSCITFSSGEWVTSHTLAGSRVYHSAWMTNKNIILIGGWDSGTTSETLIEGVASTEPGFKLKYDTRYT